MYLEPFKLKELPFRLSPDPQFLYLSKQHARAKAYMESTIWFTDGFVVITGEIGSGKTTLIESFLKEVPADVVVAQINQTQVSAIDFLQAVLVQFGFSPFKMRKAELISTLNNFLIEQYAAGRRVLLIVDEAQNLTMRVLEEIRMLSGVETTKEKVLRIILAGPAGAQREARRPAARAAHAARAPALSPADPERAGDAGLHPAPSRGRRRRRPRAVRGRHLSRDLPLLRRRAAPDQHAVRHGDDGGLHRRPRHRDARRHPRAPWRSCAGSTTRSDRATTRPEVIDRLAPAGQLHAPADGRPALARLLVATDGRTVQEIPLRSGASSSAARRTTTCTSTAASSAATTARSSPRAHSCVVEDLNSTNGIFVKSNRVRRHHLNDGDVVLLGKHELIYVDERTARARNTLTDTMPGLQALRESEMRHESQEAADEDEAEAAESQ